MREYEMLEELRGVRKAADAAEEEATAIIRNLNDSAAELQQANRNPNPAPKLPSL